MGSNGLLVKVPSYILEYRFKSQDCQKALGPLSKSLAVNFERTVPSQNFKLFWIKHQLNKKINKYDSIYIIV